MTLVELKKELAKMYSVKLITVSVGEYVESENESEYDVNICVDYLDEYLNKEFESYTIQTYGNSKDALKRAKSVNTSLGKIYRSEFVGFENC